MQEVETTVYQTAEVFVPTPTELDIVMRALRHRVNDEEALFIMGRKEDVVKTLRMIASGCEEALSNLGATR